LEIARALATKPKLLLLDEPAAGLNIRETETLAETIVRIRQRGITILLVEHDMSLVMGISDEVLVLNYGKKIAEGPPREIQKNPLVIAAYLGEEGEDA
jgi:ABC-type branched-subunit amino acid transport system ATPase component